MVIFDTSVIVDASRRKKTAIDLIESYSGKEQIATTVISKYELLRGASERDISFVTELLEKFIIYALEDRVVNEIVENTKNSVKKARWSTSWIS